MKNFTGLALFGAPWCGPCRAAKESLAGEDYRYVDLDAEPELAVQFGVVGVPQLLAICDGLEQGRVSVINKQTAKELRGLL